MANIQTIHHEQQEQRQMLEIIMHNQIAIMDAQLDRGHNPAIVLMTRTTKQWLNENKKTELPPV